jgi:hypothetical protein
VVLFFTFSVGFIAPIIREGTLFLSKRSSGLLFCIKDKTIATLRDGSLGCWADAQLVQN